MSDGTGAIAQTARDIANKEPFLWQSLEAASKSEFEIVAVASSGRFKSAMFEGVA
ncbi:MAG: hypothetical protein ACR2PF_03935 [Rhizobiaceae bacterium]